MPGIIWGLKLKPKRKEVLVCGITNANIKQN